MSPDLISARDAAPIDPALARYAKQVLFEPIGAIGQQRLRNARVILFGCGALGTVLANTLVRAGVGFLRICDRDYIETDNLQRQVLFDESDVTSNTPKAVAAAEKLRRINSEVTIDPQVIDVNPENIERLAEGFELLLDGTDNFETRFLINDLAVKTGRPWIYGAVIGATGLVMPILPGETPCLRCVFEDAPPPEMNPTCDTAGVIGPAVNVVASLQAVEVLKILVGRREDVTRKLLHIDVWSGRFMAMNVDAARAKGTCPCCIHLNFEYLDGRFGSSTTTLCGRDAVQVSPPSPLRIDFETIARKLSGVLREPASFNRFMLKAKIDDIEFTLFPDGRAIIKGTHDSDRARTLYAKYIGS